MRVKFLFILLVFMLAACGGESPEEPVEREQASPTVSFRNLDMEVEDVIFRLTGEVKTTEQTIYYHVMQGEETLMGEQAIDIASNDAWVEFEIAEELPGEARDGDEPPILTLFGKAGDGSEINPNYLPIDIGIR